MHTLTLIFPSEYSFNQIMALSNAFLLLAQAAIYFAVMMGLLRARQAIGIGVFLCALGIVHFLEAYLAAVFFISLPFGLVSSGSPVLFSGKLLLILLLYIREDALIVRQAIYGLLIGSLLVVVLVVMLKNHDTVAFDQSRLPDIRFIYEIAMLMVWGTIVLLVDTIAIILLYERIGDWFGRHLGLRFLTCGAIVLTLDHVCFFAAMHYFSSAPLQVFFGGWIAKMLATLVYTALFVVYLKYFDEEKRWLANRSFKDVFEILTYRERYHELLETSTKDHLTGALHRRQYDQFAPTILAKNLKEERSLSLLVIDIDHFKGVNDRHGHQAGDQVLTIVARLFAESLRSNDHLYRFGGEEFVLLCEDLSADAALIMANRLRKSVERFSAVYLPEKITVSVGLATAPEDGHLLEDLFQQADMRLYRAKKAGRNKVAGPPVP